MRASLLRSVLFFLLVSLCIPLAAAAEDQSATPVPATDVSSRVPTATESEGTPAATEEPVAAANAPIILTLNGVASSLFVKIGTPVAVDASPSGMWFITYYGPGCQGDRVNSYEAPFAMHETVPSSVMAYDPEVDYVHPSGPCLDITWAAPTLLLNGSPRDAFLQLNSELSAETSPGNMKINIFSGEGCETGRLITAANSGYRVKQLEAGTASLQAFDPADPTNASPCLNAAWDNFTPPDQPVELLLNGKQESITVFKNHVIKMETSPANLLLKIYDGPECAGTSVTYQTPLNQIRSIPTTRSVQAFDPNHPAYPSTCLTMAWKTPAITVDLDSWYGDHRTYYPYVPYEVSYRSEDPNATILARLYLTSYCDSSPSIDLPAAIQSIRIENLFLDNPNQDGGWSIQAYDPQTGEVSRCYTINQGKVFGGQPVPPETPVTVDPANPPTTSTSTTTTVGVTTLPNTGDGPKDSQSTTGTLLVFTALLGAMGGILWLTRVHRVRSRIALHEAAERAHAPTLRE